MITLRRASYSKDELHALLSLVNSGTDEFLAKHCKIQITQCQDCKYKHICGDMHRFINYLGEILDSEMPIDNSVDNVDNSLFDKNLSI